MLGLTMFGLAANYNSTLYAAYKASPPQYAATFFVMLNLFKILLVSLSPLIADAYGDRALIFMMQMFAGLSFISLMMSWLMLSIEE